MTLTFTTVARVAAAEPSPVGQGRQPVTAWRSSDKRVNGNHGPGVGVLTRQALRVFVVNLELLQSQLVAASRVHRVLISGD